MTIKMAIQSHLSDALIEMNHPQLQEQVELRLRFIKWLLNSKLDINDKHADIDELWDVFNIIDLMQGEDFINN
jgi:hypothetical protein